MLKKTKTILMSSSRNVRQRGYDTTRLINKAELECIELVVNVSSNVCCYSAAEMSEIICETERLDRELSARRQAAT